MGWLVSRIPHHDLTVPASIAVSACIEDDVLLTKIISPEIFLQKPPEVEVWIRRIWKKRQLV